LPPRPARGAPPRKWCSTQCKGLAWTEIANLRVTIDAEADDIAEALDSPIIGDHVRRLRVAAIKYDAANARERLAVLLGVPTPICAGENHAQAGHNEHHEHEREAEDDKPEVRDGGVPFPSVRKHAPNDTGGGL